MSPLFSVHYFTNGQYSAQNRANWHYSSMVYMVYKSFVEILNYLMEVASTIRTFSYEIKVPGAPNQTIFLDVEIPQPYCLDAADLSGHLIAEHKLPNRVHQGCLHDCCVTSDSIIYRSTPTTQQIYSDSNSTLQRFSS